MKSELELVSLACNPNAPSPTATMVKIEDGFMVAFGGLFCIRVPLQQALGCCFDPAAVKVFFRKERKSISYTVKKNKLVLQDGKERLSVGCLPPEEMVTLDVLGKVVPCELNLKLLKYLSDVIDPANYRAAAHGVTSRDGMLLATNNKVFIGAFLELPVEFNIHKDACVALARFKSKLVGVVTDKRAVKFVFEDGSSLTTLNIVEQLPDLNFLFEKGYRDTGISDALQEDLLKVGCHILDFTESGVVYVSEDAKSKGEIDAKLKFKGSIFKSLFDPVLRNQGKIQIREDGAMIRSVNENVCVIAVMKQSQ